MALSPKPVLRYDEIHRIHANKDIRKIQTKPQSGFHFVSTVAVRFGYHMIPDSRIVLQVPHAYSKTHSVHNTHSPVRRWQSMHIVMARHRPQQIVRRFYWRPSSSVIGVLTQIALGRGTEDSLQRILDDTRH